MFDNQPLIKRIVVGKFVGFLFGLIGFVCLPYFWPEAPMMFRIAVLFWYIMFGATVAIFGLMTEFPIIKIKMPWWFITVYVGAWLDLILMLFIYDTLEVIMADFFGATSIFSSPWWLVVEGAVVGWLVGFCTKNIAVKVSEV